MRHRHNPWLNLPTHSALVSVPPTAPTHSLHATITNPPHSSPTSPLLIWITGAGAPAILYTALRHHLTTTLPSVRTLFYDRAGYDRSTRDPSPGAKQILAAHSARDLWDLLDAIGVLNGPLILAAHSYGGIIAREFLQLVLNHGNRQRANPPNSMERRTQVVSIAGLLLFDTATELMLEMFPRIPSAELTVVSEGVDLPALTHLIEESGLTDAEGRQIVEATERTRAAAADEDTHGSGRLLAERRQLDGRVMREGCLVVVGTNLARDYRVMYEEGCRLGNGTEDERRRAREFVKTVALFQMQVGRVQLDLRAEEADTRYVFLHDVGHDAPLRIRRADYVGEQVRWILGRMKEQAHR